MNCGLPSIGSGKQANQQASKQARQLSTATTRRHPPLITAKALKACSSSQRASDMSYPAHVAGGPPPARLHVGGVGGMAGSSHLCPLLSHGTTLYNHLPVRILRLSILDPIANFSVCLHGRPSYRRQSEPSRWTYLAWYEAVSGAKRPALHLWFSASLPSRCQCSMLVCVWPRLPQLWSVYNNKRLTASRSISRFKYDTDYTRPGSCRE
jgi:hypothetical protein